MQVPEHDKRLRRAVTRLKNDAESLSNVKESTRAYREGKVTNLEQTIAYVKKHRESGPKKGSHSKLSTIKAAEERVSPLRILRDQVMEFGK